MAVAFPQRLKLAQLPTPLEPLDRLSAEIGGPRIWVKRDDLTGGATTGNKVRKLEFTLAEAINAGCDTVITCGGLQSNHCRATAILGAKLGLKVHLVLRGEADTNPEGNYFLDRLVGAEISCFSLAEYLRNLQSILNDIQQRYAEQGSKAWIIPTGASDGVGVWGYIGCAAELQQDFLQHGINPAAIVHATGSGGTQAGLTVGAELFALGAPVYGINVCDDEAYFMNKVRQDLHDWQQRYQQTLDIDELAIHVIDGYVGPGYAKATQDVFSTIEWVAKTEGLVLDPVYSGKAFDGLVKEIRLGRFQGDSDIVFVHTGGIFGVFPYRAQFFNVL